MKTFQLTVWDFHLQDPPVLKFSMPGGYPMLFHVTLNLFHIEIVPNLSNMSNLLAVMRLQGRIR